MNAQANILERGLEQAALAVLGASALGNLHLEPSHIGRGLAQRISGRLRQVESLVRRILFLMALQLNYVPAPKADAAPRPAAAPALPDGVELAEFPRVSGGSSISVHERMNPVQSPKRETCECYCIRAIPSSIDRVYEVVHVCLHMDPHGWGMLSHRHFTWSKFTCARM